MSTPTRRLTTAGLAAIGALLLAALTVAPDAHGEIIFACAKQIGGSVHIVTSGTKCKRGEVKLRWIGAAGPRGSTGQAGANGVNGADGVTGATGPQGAPGEPGPAGAPGGTSGGSGATGAQGLAGATGAQGLAGATGAQGVAGATGPAGPTGATGPTGPAGGATGAIGPAGATGAAGTSVVARVRSAGAVATASTTTSVPSWTSDPLTAATWSQGTEELDQLVGQVSLTTAPEATCEHTVSGSVGADVQVLLDGSPVADTSVASGPAEATETVPISWSHHAEFSFPAESRSALAAFEPLALTSHTLTAQVGDDCGANGGHGGGHFTIQSISVDVLGTR
jgi:hypothetical protein